MTKKEIEQILKDSNCCMMTTIDSNAQINSRPMLQNRDMTYDGVLYFFSMKDTRKVRDLKANPATSLTFQYNDDSLFLQVYGIGEIVETPQEMALHWDKTLNLWWPEQEKTPEICMIRIRVSWIRCWRDGKDCTIEQ